MSKDLNPNKALIFRIIHRDNIPWVVVNGLHCRSSNITDPNYISIGNPELIDKRNNRDVTCEPYGTLSEYIPFYFTPFSPMLLNIRTGYGGIRKRDNEEIVILVSSLYKLKEKNVPFVFTDRHAYVTAAQFYSDTAMLDQIDWPLLQARDFKRDPDDFSKVERYQAEALVYKHLPVEGLVGMVCHSNVVASSLKVHLERRALNVQIAIKPKWYF